VDVWVKVLCKMTTVNCRIRTDKHWNRKKGALVVVIRLLLILKMYSVI